MKKLLLLFLSTVLLNLGSFAQLELNPFVRSASGFSVVSLTDYQTLGVNPANLGYVSDQKFHIGFVEFSGGLFSEPLTRDQIFNDFFASDYSFSAAERQEAVNKFTDSRLLASGQINWLGLSYQDENLGGFAFTVRDKISFNLILNQFTSEMLFLGWNSDYFDKIITDTNGNPTMGVANNPESLAKLGNGSEANAIWTREFAFGYGRSLIKSDDYQLNIGIGAKYILGYLNAQYYSFNEGSELYSMVATSSAFNMDLGDNSLSPVTGGGLSPVGKGFGFEVGLSGAYKDKIKWGINLSDIGSINWHGNVFEGQNVDFTDIESGGINSYNLFTEAPDIEGIAGFDWVNVEPQDVKLPMNLRAGLSVAVNDMLELGCEVYYPLLLNTLGGYNNPIISGGAVLHLGVLELHGGVSYNEYYGLNTPLGLLFKFGDEKIWEIGIASRDIVGLFQQNNPGPSVAMGVIRMGI